eukprot:GDKI01030776.1.p1 GENE.GDKI01030776.1~~GDKI01030776.1.p1  ORF type:complete len:141 (-),score=10.15 GDKI01030776.1:14-436(-)
MKVGRLVNVNSVETDMCERARMRRKGGGKRDGGGRWIVCMHAPDRRELTVCVCTRNSNFKSMYSVCVTFAHAQISVYPCTHVFFIGCSSVGGELCVCKHGMLIACVHVHPGGSAANGCTCIPIRTTARRSINSCMTGTWW